MPGNSRISIVLSPGLGIGEHFIGGGQHLEFRARILIVGVEVGMVLLGEVVEGAFDGLDIRRHRNA